jgi:UDP-N-acetylmuramoylalanine--D-glutamate ligase
MTARRPAFEPGARVAVLGLGLSGAAAARLARLRGGIVYASDAGADPGPTAVAERLRAEGIDAEAGAHDMDRILSAELVVVSPGISPFSEVRRAVQEAGIRTIAEVELAFRDLRGRVVGITGTNGKTTTTRLTAHLMEGAGLRVEAVGNIGRPLSETAMEESQPDWVVVELSSFQLADLESFESDVGVLLNLAPDHLDRYRDLESYYADKGRLFDNPAPGARWVLNGDDRAVLDLAANAAGERYLFSLRGDVPCGAWWDAEDTLRARLDPDGNPVPECWATRADLPILGPHNAANAAAASLAAVLAGAEPSTLAASLRAYRGLPHRLQPLGERTGVLWVNDSKATNVAAAVAALRSFDRPVVLLLGGRHKGEPYEEIARAARGRVRAVIAFGEAAPRIVSDLQGAVETLHVETGMDAVVRAADGLARPGDVVLLAPACSSFDMFPNYAERGRAFEAAFAALPEVEAAT